MTELRGRCVKEHKGTIGYSATHRFMPYETLILRRPMYYCDCGQKITPDEYYEYSKYLIARKKAIQKYMENKK